MTDNARNTAEFAFNYPSKPMEVVRVHVDDALEHNGYDANTTISYDYSFDTDDYDDTNSDLVDIRDWWREDWLDGHSDASPQFNLLLLNSNEWPNPDGAGGVSTIGDGDDGYPRGGVLLGADIIGQHDTSPDRYGDAGDDLEGKIRASVHEIGHNLGMMHADGLRYDKDFGGPTVTYATPMGCTSNDNWETSCGDGCSANDTDTWDHYYGDCEASNITL